MKLYKYFLKTLAGLLFVSSTIFAQLELSVYTDKDSYQYGEQIELFCKVTNNADTTFEFWSGSYQSCQAEFSFNDFNSWEYTICLATTELLTFNPKSSKIYSWKINPADYGLPNNDGEQMIVGNYYFGLTDTIYINAPQYLGGKLAVGFLPNNSDSVQSIKDSLNITVLNHSDYGTSISELWQVEGFQIDSLINHFQKDSILTYMEKAVLVMYDKITHLNPQTILLRDSTLYLFQNEWNSNYADTTWLINGSSEILIVDSIRNQHYYSYKLNVLFSDETTKNFSVLLSYMDTVNFSVEPNDSVRIILSNPDFCPICEGNSLTYFTDSLQIFNNSKNNPILILGIISDGTLDAPDTGGEIKLFYLSQNYPNPFNPSTTIKYSIPVETRRGVSQQTVSLKVYDILGREVATLVNKEQKPGNYEVKFVASELNSGIYFYKLQSGDFVESKKMLLLK